MTAFGEVAAVDGAVGVPHGLLIGGAYVRDGADLTITGADGTMLVVRDYFVGESPVLTAPGGARLTPDMVSSLVRAPLQVAEATGGEGLIQIAQAAEPIGSVSKLSGAVTVQRADGSVVELQPGDPVYQGDIVITGDGGSIGIRFIDDSQFSLGSSGRMVLDEMVYDPATGEGSAGFNLLSGSFAFVSGQIAKSGTEAMQVKTPVATIGIRGTSGSISVGSSEDAELKVVLIPDADGTVGEIQVTTVTGQTFSLNVPLGAFQMTAGQPRTFTMTAQDFTREFGGTVRTLDQGDALEDRVREVPAQGDQGPQEDDQKSDSQEEGGDATTEEEETADSGDAGAGDDAGSDEGDDQDSDDGEEGDQARTDDDLLTDDDEDPNAQGRESIQVVLRDDDRTNQENPWQFIEQKDTTGPVTPQGTGSTKQDEPKDAEDKDPVVQESGTEPAGPEVITVSGRVVDPYVSGATVWIDYDNDGVQDANEPWTTTAADGSFSLSGTGGRLMSSGGTDTTTNATVGTFSAPTGASMITPVTTLMQSMISSGAATSAEDAQAKVAKALGLDLSGTDVLSLDPVASVSAGEGGSSAAGKLLAAGIMVQNVISMVSGALAGAGASSAAAEAAAFAALAASSNGQTGTSFLKDPASLQTLIGNAAANAAVAGSVDTAKVTAASSSVAKAIGNLTTSLEQAVASSGDSTGFLNAIAKVARVAQTEGKATIQSFVQENRAAQGEDVSDGFTGDALNSLLDKAEAGLSGLSQNIDGTNASEVINGTDLSNVINGFGGDDIISGGLGADTIFGGDGNDLLTGGAGNDSLDGGGGSDTASYSAATAAVTVNLSTGAASGAQGADTLVSIEHVVGGSGNDILTGDSGQNILVGGAGADTLDGGAGSDSLLGGSGDDLIRTDGTDMIDAGTGIDTVELSGTADWSGLTDRTGIERLSITSGSLTLDKSAVTAMGGSVAVTLAAGTSLADSAGGWSMTGSSVTDGVTVQTWTKGDATLMVSGNGDASGLNSAPTVSPAQGAVAVQDEDASAQSFTVADLISGRVSDTSGSTLGVAIVSVAGSGVWQWLDGKEWTEIAPADGEALLLGAATTLRFQADANWSGTPDLTFHGWDGSAGTAGTQVSLPSLGNAVSDDTTTGGIEVTAVNDAPEAQDQSLTLVAASGEEMSVLNGQITATDVDDNVLTYSLSTNASNGMVEVASDGSFSYTPDWQFIGEDSFAITVDDGNGGTSVSTVSIAVVPPAANDAYGFAQFAMAGWEGFWLAQQGASLAGGYSGDTYTSGESFTSLDLGTVNGVSYSMGQGILLTSGGIPGDSNASGSFSGTASGTGDPDMASSTDGSSLTFALATESWGVNGVLFTWMYGTEEYPNQSVADKAAIFVDGTNVMSMVDGTHVHFDNGVNESLFTNNSGGLATEYNGVVAPRLQVGRFNPEAWEHTVKLAVYDTSDKSFDSGLYFSSVAVTRSSGTSSDDWILGSPYDEVVLGGDGADNFFFTGSADFGQNLGDFSSTVDDLWFDRAGLANGAGLKAGALSEANFLTVTQNPEETSVGSTNAPQFVFLDSELETALYYDADGAGSSYTSVKVASLQAGATLDFSDIKLA